MEARDVRLGVGERRPERSEQPIGGERPAEEELDQLLVLPEVAERTADTDARRDPDQAPDLHRTGHADVHGQRHTGVPDPADPRGDRIAVERHLRRDVRGVLLLREERLDQSLLRDRRVSLRVARDADRRERVPQLSIARSRASPSWSSPRSLASPPMTKALAHPDRPASVEHVLQVLPIPEHVGREMRRRVVPARDQRLAERDRGLDPVAGRRGHGRRGSGGQRLGPLDRVPEWDQLEQRPPEERRDGARSLAGVEMRDTASATKHLHDHRPS